MPGERRGDVGIELRLPVQVRLDALACLFHHIGHASDAAQDRHRAGSFLTVVGALARADLPAKGVKDGREEARYEPLEDRSVLVGDRVGGEPGKYIGDRVKDRAVLLAAQPGEQLEQLPKARPAGVDERPVIVDELQAFFGRELTQARLREHAH